MSRCHVCLSKVLPLLYLTLKGFESLYISQLYKHFHLSLVCLRIVPVSLSLIMSVCRSLSPSLRISLSLSLSLFSFSLSPTLFTRKAMLPKIPLFKTHGGLRVLRGWTQIEWFVHYLQRGATRSCTVFYLHVCPFLKCRIRIISSYTNLAMLRWKYSFDLQFT